MKRLLSTSGSLILGLSLSTVLAGCLGKSGNALDPLVKKDDEDANIGNQVLVFNYANLDFGDIPQNPAFLDKTVEVTNSHTKDLYIKDFTSDNTMFSIVSTTCPLAPLAIGTLEKCNVVIRFSPTALGSSAGILTARYGGKVDTSDAFHSQLGMSGSSSSNPLGNTGVAFDPEIYDFGDIPAAPAYGEKIFKLKNTTSSSVWVGNVTLNNALFTIQSNSCIVGGVATELATNAECSIIVRFSPVADGEQNAFLNVTYGTDAARAGTLLSRAALSGRSNTGPMGNASLAFNPGYWDFGDVAAGQNSTKTVTITNVKSASVFISGITSSNGLFTITGNTCPSGATALAASASCQITVRFAPTTDGGQNSDIVVSYGPDQPRNNTLSTTLVVTGRSSAAPIGNAAVTFTPNYWDYGDVASGVTINKAIVVTNSSSNPVHIGSITRTNSTNFSISHDCPTTPTTLNAGATCTITLGFTPSTDGGYSSDVTVNYGPDQARSASLQSRAVVVGRSTANPRGATAVTFNPNYWDFGDVARNVSVSKQFVITNSGSDPVVISTITRTNTSIYSLTHNCPTSPSTFAAGATCTITLGFTPTADGGWSSDLVVSYGPDAARSSNIQATAVAAGRSTNIAYGATNIGFTPSYYDFGDVAAGQTSTLTGVTVTNLGSAALHLSSISSDNAKYSIQTNTCPISPSTLAAGATCTFNVRFAPTADGIQTAKITAAFGPDAPRSGNLQSIMTVAGRSTAVPAGQPALVFSPDYWDYGDLGIGALGTKVFTMTNNSTDPVYLAASGNYASSNANFFLSSTTCPAGSTPLNAGASCNITYRYSPNATGIDTTTVTVLHGPDQPRSTNLSAKLTLTGRSMGAVTGNSALTYSPTFWDFGDVAAGNTVSKAITITNSSASAIFIGNISRSNGTLFSIFDDCPRSPSSLAAGASCTLTYSFTPNADGAQNSTATILYGPDHSRSSDITAKYVVAGRSTSSTRGNASIAFTPDYWDYGDIAVGQLGTKVFTITNSSTDPVFFSNSGNFSSSNPNFFLSGSTCPTGATSLAASATCTITYRYSPSATGVDSGSVTVLYGPDQPRAGNLNAKFTIAGRSTSGGTGNSAITYSPTFYDFGDVAAGNTVSTSITVTNSSASSVYIGSVSRTNTSLFLVSDDCPRSPSAFTAGATCTLTYSFTPAADGGQTSTATINYGPDHPRSSDLQSKYVVSGRSTAATRGNSSLTFSPDYYDYGDVAANVSVNQEMTVTNSSTSAVYLSSTVSDNATFLLVASSAPCPTGSTPLAAGATCKVKVRFTPTADGPQNGNITMSYGPDQARSSNLNAKFVVTGRSTATATGNEAFTFAPDYWDFGDVAAGNTSQKTITITNFTASPVHISGITRTNTSVYSLSHNCPISPTTLAASGTCDITVTFAPTADGGQTSSLTVTYGPDAPRKTNYSSSISLAGRSTAASIGNTSFSFSPTYWDFGDVAANVTSSKTITMTNTSGAAVYIKASGGITSSNAKFTITGSNCPTGATPLANGLNCTFTVNFTPTADGAQDGDIVILHGPDQARSGNLSAKLVVSGRSTATPIGNTSIGYTPSYWDFGDVAANTTVQKTVTVTNNGSSSVYLSGVTVTNTSVFAVSDDCPRSPSALASTLTCTVTVSFTPTADGGQSADVKVLYGPDAARSANLDTKMSVSGRSFAQPIGAAGIGFNPTYYDYGNVTAGANSSTTITVQNTSSSPLYISSVAESSSEHTITANTCPTSPTALAAGGTCNVTVRYTPADVGTDIIDLTVTYGYDTSRATNLTAKAMLVGRSEPIPIGNSAIAISPNSWDFGNVALTPSYSDKVVQLTNNSTRDVYFHATLASAFSGLTSPYSVAGSDCPAAPSALAPAGVCGVTVRFSPVTGAQASATLSVNYGEAAGTPTQYSSQASFTGRSNPVAPSNFSVDASTATAISFSWVDNSFDESSFEIQRCDGSACETSFGVTAGVTVAANTQSYTWTGLTEGEFYQFRVRSKVSSTASTWLTSPMALTFGGILNTSDNGTGAASSMSQINCSTASVGGTYVNLKWTDISNAAYYQIFSTSGGVNTFLSTVNAPASNFLITGLTTGVAKEYYVQAVSASGVVSKSTATWPITTTTFSPCLVFGQNNETNTSATGVSTQVKALNVTNYQWSLNQPRAMYTDGTRLVIADQTNNRVLLWNSMPAYGNTPPDVVLGQPNRFSNTANNGGVSARSMNQPMGVYISGTKLFVSDSTNNRVLIWNTIPTTDSQAADVVLGQPGFTTRNANVGVNCNTAAVQGKSLSGPYGIWVVGTKLLVADGGNNRIMVWNTIPTSNYTAANLSIGVQSTDFTTACTAATTQSGLSNPAGIWSDGTKLFVVDRNNNRVMIWNTIPTAFGTSANAVLGHANFVTATANDTGVTAPGRLNQPWGVTGEGTNLYVADYANHRVLVFPSSAWTTGGLATAVIGQAALTTTAASNAQTGVNGPICAAADSTNSKIYVCGYGNARVTRYALPIAVPATLASSDLLLGQVRYAIGGNGGNVAAQANRHQRPWGVWSANGKVVISDPYLNRVSLYNSMPTTALPSANTILGQTGVTASDANQGGSAAAGTLSDPRGVWTDGTRVMVADRANHRVLLWKGGSFPSSHGASANGVLGQSSMTGSGAGTSATTLNAPEGVFVTDVSAWTLNSGDYGIFVTDTNNRRVMVYVTNSTFSGIGTSGATAQHVFGQASFTGSATACSNVRFNAPRSTWSDGTKLVVADTSNHRVMIWNDIRSISMGVNFDVAADIVLGQPDATTCTANTNGGGAPLDTSMNYPTHVWSNGTKLFVVDNGNHRVLVWNSFPTSTGQPADAVLGQSAFTTMAINGGNGIIPTASTLNYPATVWADVTSGAARLFVTDGMNITNSATATNARVIAVPMP